jgi:hypothetical protein
MLDNEKLRDLYATIGAAVWHLQFLEDALVTYLAMRTIGRPCSAEEANDALAKQRRKTLGVLMGEARAAGIFGSEVADAHALLTERNWLIHRSMYEASDDAYNDANRQQLVARVRALTERSISLKNTLYRELVTWCRSQGLNVDAAEVAGVEQFRKLRRG